MPPPSVPLLPPIRLILHTMDRAIAWRLVAGSLLTAANALLTGLAPAALKGTVDAAISTANTLPPISDAPGIMALYAGAFLFCLCAGRIASEARPALSSAGEQRLFSAIRRGFLRHVLDLPLGFHLNQGSGTLPHALQQAITGCQFAMLSASTGIVPVIVEGVTVAAVLASLHQPALIVTFAATAGLYLAVMTRRADRLGDAARAVSAAGAVSNGILTDSLTNIEPIKCFGAEHVTMRAYAAALSQAEARWHDLLLHRLRTGLATTAIFAVSIAVTLIIAILAVRSGQLTVGGFVLVSVYLAQMVRPLELLAAATRDLSQGLAFMSPLIAILEEPAEPYARVLDDARPSSRAPGDARSTSATVPDSAQPSRAPSVRFQRIGLAYETGRPVLDRLSLEIGGGKSLGIVGASGSGKSSLVRLLLRFHAPQNGEIFLNGTSIEALPLPALRAMIAVVPQDTVLFNTTIAANIAIGKEAASQAEIERAGQLAGLDPFIAGLPLGYDTAIGERGLKLSGGERQRIAIARAVLKDPAIYVFDEATSMLDGPTERAILNRLRAISTGRTTIVIAHRLSAVQHLDEIAVIAAGTVAERGSHAALVAADGHYAAMWRTQVPSGSG